MCASTHTRELERTCRDVEVRCAFSRVAEEQHVGAEVKMRDKPVKFFMLYCVDSTQTEDFDTGHRCSRADVKQGLEQVQE